MNPFYLLCVLILSSCLYSCSSNNTNQKKKEKTEQPSRATPPKDFSSPSEEKVIRNPGPECYDAKKVNPDQVCVDLFDPVCGCNQKTYSNSCQAEKEGILKWEKGTCN